MKRNTIRNTLNYIKTLIIPELLIKHKSYIYSYLTLLTGLTLCSMFIYIRFLRSRLPRDIPFSLTFYMFGILLLICFMYLYTIKGLFKPNTLTIFPASIIKPIQYFVISLRFLDLKIKSNTFVRPHYTKLVEYLVPIILNFGSIDRVLLTYFLMLIPGYILLFILMVDVFWLHQIKIFYYFIFLGLLPLLYSYYKHSLLVIKEEYFTQLESIYSYIKIYDENYDYHIKFEKFNPKAIYHQKEVSVREYFDIQLKHQDIEYPEYDEENPESYEIIYVGHAFSKPERYNQYKIEHKKFSENFTHEDFQVLQKELYTLEPKLLRLMEYIELNKYTHDVAYIKELRIILYSLYFITWAYILVKSLHTLPGDTFTWLMPEYENPFI